MWNIPLICLKNEYARIVKKTHSERSIDDLKKWWADHNGVSLNNLDIGKINRLFDEINRLQSIVDKHKFGSPGVKEDVG